MKKRGSILVGVIILMTGMITLGLGLNTAVLATTIKTQRAYHDVMALSIAEGGIEKAVWKLNQPGSTYTGTNGTPETSIAGGEFEILIENNCGTNCKRITSTAFVPNKANFQNKKSVRVKIQDQPSTTGVAFNYGVQAGPLGIVMSNNSSISGVNGAVGNVYAQGTISGGNNTVVTGDVIMSGASGKIDTVQVDGNAKAHTIVNSTVGKDAYYQSVDTQTKVRGVKCQGNQYCHPNSTDPTNINMPISNQTITEWETLASSGGTYEGNLNLSGNVSLGPKKINGDLTADNGTVLTITGTVWVTGNINLANNMVIILDGGYGNNGGLIIADSPTDKASYGKVTASNNVKVCGSIPSADCANNVSHPENKSSIMFLSTNTGATTSNPAIRASNNSSAVIYYSTVGMLEVANNGGLKAFTGGGLHLSNGAQVTYDQGLASAEFSGGPGGSWVITEWQILH